MASLGTVQENDKLRVVRHQNCLSAGYCSAPGTYPTQDEPTATYKLSEAWGAHFGDGKMQAQNVPVSYPRSLRREQTQLVIPRGQESGSLPPSVAYSSSNTFLVQPQFLPHRTSCVKKHNMPS